MGTLQTLDWIVIAAYFGILLSVAWWVVRKGKDNAADYFLAGRNLSWWIIGASIFASNIGSEHIVGLAGSGAPKVRTRTITITPHMKRSGIAILQSFSIPPFIP